MRNPLSKVTEEIKPSGIRKFFDIATTMDDVISLGVGEPDFQTPWQIRKAGINSLERGKTKYTANKGYDKLLKEISKDKLVFVVSHNIDLFSKYSDKIYYMKDGELYD